VLAIEDDEMAEVLLNIHIKFHSKVYCIKYTAFAVYTTSFA
jgi:hypothetical protein